MLHQQAVRHSRPFSNLFAALILACGIVLASVHAQEDKRDARTPRRAPVSKNKFERTTRQMRTAKEKRADALRVRRERQQAVSVVVETAEGACSFEDLHYRARIQSLAADALWTFDETTARAIFRRAWDAATASDASEPPRESGSVFETGASASTAPASTYSREEVLSLVARHDARLAGVFLREMTQSLSRNKGNDSSATESDAARRRELAWMESGLQAQRLGLAFSLLEDGEYRRAAELAAPAVAEGASGNLLTFLLRLRYHAAPEADALYMRLLERTRLDVRAGPNDVLLLSSYVVSPKLLTVVDQYGSIQFRPIYYRNDVEASAPPVLSPALRRAFFDVAANVLLQRALAPGAGDEAARARKVAQYFAAGRLLPFFAQEAAQYVPELQALQSTLAATVSGERGEYLSAQMRTRSITPENSTDRLRPDVEKVARATTDAERDTALVSATATASRLKLWGRAREMAARISDAELRRAALTLIQSHQVVNVLEAYGGEEDDDEDLERAVSFVRAADVPSPLRAAGFSQAAELAARRGRRERAVELLNEAVNFAEQSEQGTHERLAVFGMLTMAASRAGSDRAEELLATTVRAANALPDYTDDDLSLEFKIKHASLEINDEVSEPFGLDEVFAAAARRDSSRALAEARTLTNAVPRALAFLAVARAMLDKGGAAQGRSSTEAVR